MAKNQILVIDNDEMSYKLVTAAIGKEYQIVKTGQNCVQKVICPG